MLSKQTRQILIGLLILVAFVALLTLGVNLILRSLKPKITSGIASGLDKLAEQQLKTAVALIELHKVRYGQYPQTMKDLKFTGEWDAMALNCVAYYPNADRTAYFIEFKTYWTDDQPQPETLSEFWPEIELPAEFWQGTGYDLSVRPQRHRKPSDNSPPNLEDSR